MSRRVRDWCDICRDTEPDIKCVSEGCGRKFHESCLRTLNLWDASSKRDAYVCADCTAANVNDCSCYICKKELYAPPPPAAAVDEEEEEQQRRSKRGRLLPNVQLPKPSPPAECDVRSLTREEAESIEGILLCDGCSNSVHMACLDAADGSDYRREDDELWFCTECDPHGETARQMTENKKRVSTRLDGNASPSQTTRTKIGGNVDICYVCQKGGKLLGCDFCEQSYHPRCIDSEFLEFEQVVASQEDLPGASEKWRCPLCKGQDPLKSMSTRRLSRTAMLRMQREMQKCIQQQHRISKANRDRFLWSSRHAMRPFMMDKAMARLTKLFGKKKRKPAGSRSAEALEDSDETEEEDGGGGADEGPAGTRLKMTNMERLEKEAVEAYLVAVQEAKKSNTYSLNGGLLKSGVLLKPYQIVGVGWLLHSFFNKAGAILADEMGLGKTVQCLTFISALKAMRITGPHLIVVPLSTVGNWAREIRRFVPHLKFVKICGSRFERDHIMADVVASQGLHDLYITTYETVVTEESFFCDNFDWQCIILDEAHRIKNESGRIRHSLDRVCANMRVLLTGTPLQNNIKELFTLLNFMFPEILEHSDEFERAFLKTGPAGAGTGGATGVEDTEVDQDIMNSLFHLLSKMMLRRTKDLVVRLPKKVEHDIWLPLSPTSAYWYKQLLDVSEAAFESQSVRKLLGTVIKMRICTCHPKGLVSRDSQLTKFAELFQSLDDRFADLLKQAEEMKSLKGEPHVEASSKLLVLDKLLMQLHIQNLKESSVYKRAYEQNLRDLFVQQNPLPSIPVPKAKPKRKAASAANSSVVKKDGSNTPPVGEVKSETEDNCAAPEPTARQAAEKARRERQALLSLQQRELDERCDEAVVKLIQECLTRSDNSLEWLRDAMLPGEVSDAPVPIVRALLAAEEPEVNNTPDEERTENNTDEDSVEDDEAEEEGDGSVEDDAEDDGELTPKQQGRGTDTEDEDDRRMEDGSLDNGVHETAQVVISPLMRPATPPSQPSRPASGDIGSVLTSTGVDETKLEVAPPPPPQPEKRIPHKVLIFTQFQLVLDELEDYCKFRGFKYLRLDGSTNKMIRELDIREFNSPDSSHLVYLICTRAGGVGINLITANHVVLYDEDWNPFMDLQAIDRAHRIGQKREVHVWKLVTEWTVEERMAFRRLQKLKLDKLFIQANNVLSTALSESTGECNTANVEDEDHTAEKFSVDEIRRLIRYGREAIKSLVKGGTKCGAKGGDLPNWSLTEIMARRRQKLPDFATVEGEDENESVNVILSADEGGMATADEEEVILPVDEDGIVQDVGSDQPASSTAGLASRMSTSADEEVDGELAAPGTAPSEGSAQHMTEEEAFEEAKRSRRLRRRVFTASGVSGPGASASGSGTNSGAAADAANKLSLAKERKILHDKRCFRCGSGNNAMDENADPLIACHRCPRVYHMKGCLGFDMPPRKTWVCQWHECSLCFRKGSQAGGMLIHCGECPTTFCFDCFPPEYKRWHPPATYFAELNRRGYHITADKLVLFLCSRCKALKEQQRRRMLTKQQMDVEMRKRREIQEKARKDTQQRIKETIKETLKEDSAAAIALATALARRGGDIKKNFLARKKLKDEQDKESLNNIRSAYQRLFPEEFINVLKEKRANQIAAKSEATLEDDKMTTSGGAPAGKLLVSKLPSEYCKVCDNCHLPGHEIAHCPFPQEAVKKPDAGEGATPILGGDESPNAATAASKRVMRSYCPKCGVSSRNHCRRHCDLLTDEDREEYESRKEKINQFVECLNNAPAARLPPNTVCNVQNVESTRRFLQKNVDQVVRDCLKQAGLEACVSTQQQVKLGRRKKRRISEESGGEESGVEDEDEDRKDPLNAGQLSPRKRARNEDVLSDASGGEDSQPGKVRPRRKVKPPASVMPGEEELGVTARKKSKSSPLPTAPVISLPPPPNIPAARMTTPPITAFMRPPPVPAPQSFLPPGSAAARQQTMAAQPPYWHATAAQYAGYGAPPQARGGWPPYPAAVSAPSQQTAFAFGMPPGSIPGSLPPSRAGPPLLYGWSGPPPPGAPGACYPPIRQVGLNQHGLQHPPAPQQQHPPPQQPQQQ